MTQSISTAPTNKWISIFIFSIKHVRVSVYTSWYKSLHFSCSLNTRVSFRTHLWFLAICFTTDPCNAQNKTPSFIKIRNCLCCQQLSEYLSSMLLINYSNNDFEQTFAWHIWQWTHCCAIICALRKTSQVVSTKVMKETVFTTDLEMLKVVGFVLNQKQYYKSKVQNI